MLRLAIHALEANRITVILYNKHINLTIRLMPIRHKKVAETVSRVQYNDAWAMTRCAVSRNAQAYPNICPHKKGFLMRVLGLADLARVGLATPSFMKILPLPGQWRQQYGHAANHSLEPATHGWVLPNPSQLRGGDAKHNGAAGVGVAAGRTRPDRRF